MTNHDVISFALWYHKAGYIIKEQDKLTYYQLLTLFKEKLKKINKAADNYKLISEEDCAFTRSLMEQSIKTIALGKTLKQTAKRVKAMKDLEKMIIDYQYQLDEYAERTRGKKEG